MDADAVRPVAFDPSGFTTQNVSAQTELVTQHGWDQNASSAGSFTASCFSTCSSSIYASSLITSTSAAFDQKLITSVSEISQSIANGEIEKIEGEGDFRMRRSSCLDIHCLPLHVETTEGGGSREILHAPLQVEIEEVGGHVVLLHGFRIHEVLRLLHAELIGEEGALEVSSIPTSGGEEKVYYPAIRSPSSSNGGERGNYSPAALLHADASVHSPADDGSGLSTLTAARPSRVYELPVLLNRAGRPPANDENDPYGAVDCIIPVCDSLSLTLVSSAPVPCPIDPHPSEILLLCVPTSPPWGGTLQRHGGGDITVIGYGFMVDDDLPGMNFGVTISIDAPMHGASRKLWGGGSRSTIHRYPTTSVLLCMERFESLGGGTSRSTILTTTPARTPRSTSILLCMTRVCLLPPRAYAAGLLRLRLRTTQVCRIVFPPSPGSRLKQERCRPRVTGATRR